MRDELADDVAALSAATLYNRLPSLMQGEPPETYAALAAAIRAAIECYKREARPAIGKPSDN